MKNKKTAIIISGLVFGFILVFRFASAAPVPQVKVDPGFYDQYKEYLGNLPAPTALNGGSADNMQEVLPPYIFPFSIFKINIDGNQAYQRGDSVSLKGTLNYLFKGDDIKNQIADVCKKNAKDPSKCSAPTIYEVPQMNDLGIFVQVFRKDDDKNNNKGDYLVDEFYTAENLSLKSGESKDFNLGWKVPAEIKPGNYYFSLSLNKDKDFEVLGSPLSVASGAKTFDFQVQGGDVGSGIELDKNNIKINGQDYSYRSPAPTIKLGDVTVEIPLTNLNTTSRQAAVRYDLYRWGQINPKDLINTKTENINLEGNLKSVPLKYTFTPNDADSIYNLKITVTNGNSKTESNIRFAVENKNRGIVRYLDVVKNGDGYSPLVCIRNANWSGSFQGKVKITLGNSAFEQEGSIDSKEGACFMITDPKLKITEASCNSNKLKAEISSQEQKLTDSQEVSLNCQTQANVSQSQAAPKSGGQSFLKLFLALVFVLIIAVLAYVYLLKNNNSKKDTLNNK